MASLEAWSMASLSVRVFESRSGAVLTVLPGGGSRGRIAARVGRGKRERPLLRHFYLLRLILCHETQVRGENRVGSSR